MEPAGLAFGIAGLFNSVLAIVDGLSSFQSCDKDVHGFSVMVSADYHRLLHWGKEVGLLQNDYLDGPYELHPRLNDQGTYVAVCNLLTLAIETFGEAKEVMQKHKSKTELSGSSRSFSFTSSSRQVKENLRGISRSWSFPSKRKALENAVEMGILADQYGNTTEKRTFPTKKATRATRMKWACFRKSQAQELEQKLQRFVDKLVALVPVQGNDAQHNFENSGTNKLVKDDGEKSIEGLDTDGFVTNFEGYTLAGVNSNGGGVSQVVHSVDSRRKLKFRKTRKLRMQYSSRQGVKKMTGRVARINRNKHAENVLLGLYGAKMAAYGSAAGSLVFFFPCEPCLQIVRIPCEALYI